VNIKITRTPPPPPGPFTRPFLSAFCLKSSTQPTPTPHYQVLFRNSITYSALDAADKQASLELWEAKWDAFVEDALLHLATTTTTTP
jgi:hypothetical protein